MMGRVREWYRQQRVRKKVSHFIRLATSCGWVTARLPEPTPLRHGRVLVLAPHVDDEAIGCGGTLWLHRHVNDPVHVAYVLADARRQAVREAEGDRAGALLGAAVTHLRCPQDPDAVREALKPLLLRERPDVIYVPWLLDNHEGHQVVHRALGSLLEQGVPCGEVWCYEVWSPLVPNRIVDITSVLPRKTELLRLYASQLAHKDIANMALGLSAYRGGFLGRKDSVAAEVFLALSSSEYRRFGKQLLHATAAR